MNDPQANAQPASAAAGPATAASVPGRPAVTATGFPGGYQGAGPVFAAVPLGEPWHDLAARGATTYVVRPANLDAPGAAFVDRAQAEAVADAVADGEFCRWEGLTGYYDCTPARAEAERQAAGQAAPEAGS